MAMIEDPQPAKVERSPRAIRAKRVLNPAVKAYLVAYNILSAIGWSSVLVFLLIHLFNLDAATTAKTTGTTTENTIASLVERLVVALTRLFGRMPYIEEVTGFVPPTGFELQLPEVLVPYYRRASTMHAYIGWLTAFVQSFAVLEVFHSGLGWVGSPLGTTIMQVASRIMSVWGIAAQFEAARTNPLYTSMVLAWSATEIIRYSFYAFDLLGSKPYPLLYLRYTTFYILYPVGALSEAALMYSALPKTSPVPGFEMPSFQSYTEGVWKLADYVRGGLLLIWVPGLYVMYTYMISQRRKTLGSGGGPKTVKTQ